MSGMDSAIAPRLRLAPPALACPSSQPYNGYNGHPYLIGILPPARKASQPYAATRAPCRIRARRTGSCRNRSPDRQLERSQSPDRPAVGNGPFRTCIDRSDWDGLADCLSQTRGDCPPRRLARFLLAVECDHALGVALVCHPRGARHQCDPLGAIPHRWWHDRETSSFRLSSFDSLKRGSLQRASGAIDAVLVAASPLARAARMRHSHVLQIPSSRSPRLLVSHRLVRNLSERPADNRLGSHRWIPGPHLLARYLGFAPDEKLAVGFLDLSDSGLRNPSCRGRGALLGDACLRGRD